MSTPYGPESSDRPGPWQPNGDPWQAPANGPGGQGAFDPAAGRPAAEHGGFPPATPPQQPGPFAGPDAQPGQTFHPGYESQHPYGNQPGYGGRPDYGAQPGYQAGYGAQPGYQNHPGYGAQPGYENQPGYANQPQYGAQPGYGAEPSYGYGQAPAGGRGGSSRRTWWIVGGLVGLITVVGLALVLLATQVLRGAPTLPDELAGMPRVTSGVAQTVEKEAMRRLKQESGGVDGAARAYSSDGRVAVAVVVNTHVDPAKEWQDLEIDQSRVTKVGDNECAESSTSVVCMHTSWRQTAFLVMSSATSTPGVDTTSSALDQLWDRI